MSEDDFDLERIASLIISGVDRLEGTIQLLGTNGFSTYKYKAYRVLKTIRIDISKENENP